MSKARGMAQPADPMERTFNPTDIASAEGAFVSDGAMAQWRPLALLNVYRVTATVLLLLLLVSDIGSQAAAGEYLPELFLLICDAYLVFGLVAAFAIRWQRPPFKLQLYIHLLVDIAAITLLVHASGGVQSGLGMLLVVAMAGAGMLTTGREAILFAAIATIGMLGQEVYTQLHSVATQAGYTHAGLLGVIFFATAGLAHVLARRARESEALAQQRGVDLANMERLTEYIIQRMQTGVVVIDSEERVRLMNESAWHLLGMPVNPANRILDDVAPPLAVHRRIWQQGGEAETFTPAADGPAVLPRFAQLDEEQDTGTLIFLEDTAATTQQAQQMKLASLGRLTASIAHEIRNPLGAISHADQLLAESSNLDPGDRRLTGIIQEHCQRMNTIVENVLQLSRRQRSRPQDFLLKPWLMQAIDEFVRTEAVDPEAIRIDVEPSNTRVRFDPSQLQQVLWNLCHNGIRHSLPNDDGPRLMVSAGISPESPNPFLDVTDNGPGIDREAAQHIFEPFFTSEKGGTGLGLYIARELCEGNQARLSYLPAPSGGSCFRITFADPRRKQWT